ncbi:MAG TPA: lysophospholipid acyltransferase family protein [Myxococcota bacterium]|nr:lysophospholipid acyltransferase family protein [Myxococcota bacterium]
MPKLSDTLREAFSTGFTAAWTTMCFFMVTIPLPLSPKGAFSQWIVRRIWAPGLLKGSGIAVVATGQERLDPRGAYIFMSNHQSLADVPVIFDCLPHNLRFVAKKELLYVPFFGLYLYLAGYPLIDRRNRREAIRSLQHAGELIRSGIPVVSFPEGTRTRDGNVGPFKKGAFVLALEARVPIVPVAISGSDRLMRRGRLAARPGTVRVHFGAPMDLSGYAPGDRDRLMADVREVIIAQKERLDREAEAAGERA